MLRTRSAEARRSRLLWRAALLLLALAASARPPARAQGLPRVEVERYAPRVGELAGSRYVFVHGLLENHGPGPATDIRIALQVFGEDREQPLRVAGSISWLDALDSGAIGPFAIAVNYCCPEDIREYRFQVSARAAAERPYPGLRFEDVERFEADGRLQLGGLLRNQGAEVVLAPSVDVYAGFWAGEELVALETARMPILYGLEGATGQSLPPGLAYPWILSQPGLDFDRYQLWANGRPYPSGVYPVPLGFDDPRIRRQDEDLLVSGMLRHCGRQPSEAALLLLVGYDARRRVRDFELLELVAPGPIQPGARGPLAARWPAPDPAVVPETVELTPLSMSTQTRRPQAIPCAPLPARGFLPSLRSGSAR